MTIERIDTPAAVAWVPDDASFGARLALIRQRMQWGNVKEAALACGLPTESWRTWERDNVVPRDQVRVAERIADRTGCDFDWLLRGRRGVLPTARLVPTRSRVKSTRRPPDNRPNGLPRTSAHPGVDQPTVRLRRKAAVSVDHSRGDR